MKSKLSPKEAVGSLAFPVLLLLPCLALLTLETLCADEIFFGPSMTVTAVCGGIAPIVLTLVFKADTSKFLVSRLAFLLGSAGAFAAAAFIGSKTYSIIPAWTVLATAVLFPAVYYTLKADNWVKRTVICLSNPAIYFIVFVIELYYCLNTFDWYYF